ncbi:MAG: glycosyltransferase family 4 protein [Alphaproteobacteria bacterium]|jgi:glycosyltransferase involved in cell wall biosynthesis
MAKGLRPSVTLVIMRILLLSDNFVPETNSPARRAYEHARVWAATGHSVTVITSVPNFPIGRPLPPYRNRLRQRERIDGIDVVRVWTLLAPNRGVVRRSLDFLSFALAGFTGGLFEPCDVIVATSPQLLTGLAGWWLAAVKRRPWVFEVRDIWPDSIVSVGMMKDNLFIRALHVLERQLYRHATRVVAVSGGIRERLLARGVPAEKLGVVPNGVDLRRFGGAKQDYQLRQSLRLQGKFVAGYVGTHGMAQGLETVVDAADRLRGRNIHFLFVGAGARRPAIVARATAMNLDNVTFIDLVPIETATEYLRLCDAVLIPLKRTDQIEITLPGKLFEAAAMGKPMIVGAEGASTELVQRYGAGIVVPPEDPKALADGVLRLREDSALCGQLSAGSLALARDFDRDHFAREMLEQISLACETGATA